VVVALSWIGHAPIIPLDPDIDKILDNV
jgi:hypothetical protein